MQWLLSITCYLTWYMPFCLLIHKYSPHSVSVTTFLGAEKEHGVYDFSHSADSAGNPAVWREDKMRKHNSLSWPAGPSVAGLAKCPRILTVPLFYSILFFFLSSVSSPLSFCSRTSTQFEIIIENEPKSARAWSLFFSFPWTRRWADSSIR